MRTGGSNYISIGGSLSDRPAIGALHEGSNRETATAELTSMFEHGQRQITLVCWFGNMDFPATKDSHRWQHIVDGSTGALWPQHQQNVIDLLALLQGIGYREVHFRFGLGGDNNDVTWQQWNADQFNKNWSFINSTRNLVVANAGTMRVVIDLGVEQANDRLNASPFHRLYVRRMWKLYTDSHGPADSCGFSILHGGVGAAAMLQTFRDGKLPLPGCYCLDSYENVADTIPQVAQVLRDAGEIAKPFYLQETLYNDAQVYADLKQAVADTSINFQGLFQWPKVRGLDPHVFPDVYPKRFDNYLIEQ